VDGVTVREVHVHVLTGPYTIVAFSVKIQTLDIPIVIAVVDEPPNGAGVESSVGVRVISPGACARKNARGDVDRLVTNSVVVDVVCGRYHNSREEQG
jgi:hypothetical protein